MKINGRCLRSAYSTVVRPVQRSDFERAGGRWYPTLWRTACRVTVSPTPVGAIGGRKTRWVVNGYTRWRETKTFVVTITIMPLKTIYACSSVFSVFSGGGGVVQ